jgi:hypothetical protein
MTFFPINAQWSTVSHLRRFEATCGLSLHGDLVLFMSTLQWTRIYGSIRAYVACYDVILNEDWYGISYWIECLGRSFWLLRQEMRQEEHSYTPTGSIGCGKERGWEERTNAVLIVLFNFVPRLPENLSHALSLSLSLSLSQWECVPCTQYGIRETLGAEQFKILEHRATEVGGIMKYFIKFIAVTSGIINTTVHQMSSYSSHVYRKLQCRQL